MRPKESWPSFIFPYSQIVSQNHLPSAKWHICITTIEQIIKYSKFEMKTHVHLRIREHMGPKGYFDQQFFNVIIFFVSSNGKCRDSWDMSLEFYHLNHIILKTNFIGAIAIIYSFPRVMANLEWFPIFLLISKMEGKNNEWLPYRTPK